jgi:hypothetical protein
MNKTKNLTAEERIKKARLCCALAKHVLQNDDADNDAAESLAFFLMYAPGDLLLDEYRDRLLRDYAAVL